MLLIFSWPCPALLSLSTARRGRSQPPCGAASLLRAVVSGTQALSGVAQQALGSFGLVRTRMVWHVMGASKKRLL